jgi:cytochrome c-type biogenesis protein CcmH/NrfF
VIVLAHAGHWLPQLLYLVPVVALVVAVMVSRRRERRAAQEGREEDKGSTG